MRTLLLVVWGVVLGFVVAEAGFALTGIASIFEPVDPKGTGSDHELFGWFHIPKSEFTYRTRYVDFGTPVQINGQGFRGPEYPYQKGTDTFRILVLGDSFTASFEVPIEQAWHRILEAGLNSRAPLIQTIRKVEVIGIGVQGWSTDQQLLFYRFEGYKYDPDLVLLQFFLNDIEENDPDLHTRGSLKARKPYFVLRDDGRLDLMNFPFRRAEPQLEARSPSGSPIRRLRTLLRSNLRTYRLLEGMLSRRPRPRPFCWKDSGVPSVLFIYAPVYPPEWSAAWRLTANLIKELRHEVQRGGRRFAVVNFPDRRQVVAGAWRETLECWPKAAELEWDLDRPNNLLRDFLRAEGVPYLDVTSDLREYITRTGVSLYFPRDWHFNPAGHERVADLLSTWLVRDRLVRGGLTER